MQRIDDRSLVAAEKPELTVLPTPELNAETPAHLLDEDITPTDRLFVRNTGFMPGFSDAELAAWMLTIDGCVRAPRRFSLDALKRDFETVSQIAVMECAGNGRAFFKEQTSTVLWGHGAAGCPRWTGVRLGDVLRACGVTAEAVYTGHHSPDLYLDDSGPALSRGLPIAKALAPETMLAFGLNGAPLPPIHGGPLRIIAPGYPGAASQKWLTRIELRDREHDGERMAGLHYRMPRVPMQPGDPIDESLFDVITDMPVRSVITFPADGARLPAGTKKLDLRGHTWAGDNEVKSVDISTDYGATWKTAKVDAPKNKFAWQRFTASIDLPTSGYYEVWSRATDAKGATQPFQAANWNPQGYGGNPVAYLVEEDELNADYTNFWIFTEEGLKRIVRRAGWDIPRRPRGGGAVPRSPSPRSAGAGPRASRAARPAGRDPIGTRGS